MPELTKENMTLSPLADPVIGAIFANKEVAGLAAESLIRVTLEAANQDIKIGKVISVTPQRSYIDARNRSCRVDVETETDENEIVIFEVETTPNYIITQRDILSAAQIFTRTSVKGDTDIKMAHRMPKYIAINILNYNIRKDNKEVLQPFGIMYTKPPIVTAARNFAGYHVQLPRLLETEADFNDPFYCWYYTLYTAHRERKTVQEVLEMTPQLQEYAKLDKGYEQFCNQYKFAASDPQTRDEYFLWYKGQMHEIGIRDAGYEDGRAEGWQEGRQEGRAEGRQEGRAEGRQEGRAEGRQEGRAEGRQEERQKAEKEMNETIRKATRSMTNAGMDDKSIADTFGLPLADINKYR